jgi:RNA polymerase sigma factor (sigma-70 family)
VAFHDHADTFYSRYRVERREQTGFIEDAADHLHMEASQDWALQRKEIQDAIERLPPHQRQVLVLIGVLGISYEETARICGCAIGTVKSRLSRARDSLLADLGEPSPRAAVEHSKVLSDHHFYA